MQILFVLFANIAFSQNGVKTIVFSPVYGNEVFNLIDSVYVPKGWNDISVETLKFYISNIRFYKKGKEVFAERNSVHLLDASVPSSMQIEIETPVGIHFNQLVFDLGVDSTTNVSGAMGGDLDPTNGMYWTWQSGYINFKLEGKSEASPARNNEYQFHLGGYLSPYNNLKTIRMDVPESNSIYITLNIENIINEIDISKLHHVMSPGDKALMLSAIVSESFNLSEE